MRSISKGGMEFNSFRNLPHLLVPVACELAAFLRVMEAVNVELARRRRLLQTEGVENLAR
jgi:DNA segregation ATPase FtsK/SpoIIIE-like protein